MELSVPTTDKVATSIAIPIAIKYWPTSSGLSIRANKPLNNKVDMAFNNARTPIQLDGCPYNVLQAPDILFVAPSDGLPYP